MSLEIWKFPLMLQLETEVDIPGLVKVLDVQLQGRVPVVWATVNPGQPSRRVLFTIYATGQSLDRKPRPAEVDEPFSFIHRVNYVGTFQLEAADSDPFVGHVFWEFL